MTSMAETLRRAPKITARAAVVACVVLYAVTAGVGLIQEGYNVDDWRHITGGYGRWVASEGRWLVDFIFRALLGERFVTPLQVFLSFFAFLWIAFTLAKYAVVEDLRPATAALIFAAGVNFPYMCDALSFNAHIFAYAFALAASLAGFHMIFTRWRAGRRLYNAALFVMSAQMIGLSLAIYQPFALFGLVVPVLCALRSDQTPLGVVFQRSAICALACVLAVALFLLEWRLYAGWIGVEIVSLRFESPTVATTLHKIGQLPDLWKRILSGALLAEPRWLRIAEALFAIVTMGAALCGGFLAWLKGEAAGTARLTGALRPPAAAAGALLVLPAIFWFATTDSYAPSRAIGFLGFVLAAVIAASAGLCLTYSTRRRWIVGAAGAALVAMGLVHALAASTLWDDRARMSQREIALARALYARIAALPGHDGRRVRMIGNVHHPDLNWGDLLGLSVFHDTNPTNMIFRELFDAPLSVESMSVSPRACRAFPHPQSAFVYDGVAHVCLNDFDAFLPVTDCAPLGGPDQAQLCVKGRAVAYVTATCAMNIEPQDRFRILVRDARGGTLVQTSLEPVQIPAVMMEGRCFRIANTQTDDYASLSVSLYRIGQGEVWSRDYIRPDLRARQ